MKKNLLTLLGIWLLFFCTALTVMAQQPQINVFHYKSYFRTQTNAVMMVYVKTFSSSDGLQVVLNPDPNFTITRINAPAKWTCDITTKTCTRTNDGTSDILELIQIVGTISANAPATPINASTPTTMTNSATLTGGALGSPRVSTDNVPIYNPAKVVQWGLNGFGELANLPTYPGFTELTNTFRTVVGLTSDGSIVEWGNTSQNAVSPPTGNGYLAISAGTAHTVALTGDGRIVSWGLNTAGQQNGVPTGNGFVALRATDRGVYAITNEGLVVYWGNINTTDFSTGAKFVDIASGYDHGIGRSFNGSISQWGSNNIGQRNNQPPGGGWKALASTSYNGIVQRQDGTLYEWGSSSNNPAAGLPTAAVAAFGASSLSSTAWAMNNDGSIMIWGDAFNAFQTNKPTTGGYALNSVTSGGTAANALLPLANPILNGGNAQSALANTAFTTPLSVRVLDNLGNPVSNLSITFTAPNAGASGTFSTGTATITVSTDASGVASAGFTANGQGGAYNVTASYPGLDAASFSLSNTLSNPTETSNPTICANTSARLSANCAAGNVVWYDAAGTNIQFTGSPFTTPNLTSNTLYKVACSSGIRSDFTNVNVSIALTRLYVKENASGANNGSSWADAFPSLQDALAAACSGAQIWVAAGTYKPTADPSGNTSPANARTKTFVMKNGVAIYGGFSGTETQLSERNWRSNLTILSGNIGNSGVDTDNSYRVINNTFTSGSPLDNTAILDGFIVEKGYADGGFPLNLGGGMWNSNASPKIQNCVFRNNYAVSGGGMFNNSSSSGITNCLFLNNTVTTAGAGISNGGATDMVKVINCTFYGNAGPTTIANERSATSISNSIVWGNGGGVSGGTVTYCTVQGGFSGTGNINIDPRFVNVAGGDFRLQQCSPAIDNGTNADIPATDFEGNVRPFSATGVSKADMGAYEYQSTYDVCSACANITTGILYVNASVSGGSNNGSSWMNAFRDLQSALTLARTYPSCVTQIWVAKGTYKPTSGSERGISFSMVNGVAMYGGFPNDGTGTMANRHWNTNPTILSGDIGMTDDKGDNSFNVILNNNNGLNNTAVLNGFTISDGNATDNSNSGGGMNNIGSSPYILNCKFLNNSASYIGGGINNSSASPLIANCVFVGNSAGADGGAICNLSSTSTIINCSFSANTSPIGIITAINTSSIVVTNCAFESSSQSVTISPTSSVSISYCISPRSYNGSGNINANPLFVNAVGGDFRLQPCSPAINAGDPATTSATVGNVDLGSNPRFYNSGRVDIGAYEYQGTFDAVAPVAQVTNSVCTTFGGTASGGSISAPSGSCPAGSTLQYSTDNGGNWSTTIPTYAQSGPAQTILTRCTCDANPTTFGPTSTVTTSPGTCPTCPVLTVAAPAVQVTNSVCQAGCTIGGGSISVPSTSCPAGSTLQYQLNGGSWSTTLPTYAQTGPAQTIKTRCVCNTDANQVSPESSVTTIPGTVPALVVPSNGSAVVSCPALAIAPTLPVVNDCTGNPITPSAPVITNDPTSLTCEGTRTYTYSYVCGSATATWSFVYSIEREPFTISVANGSATVYDPALAVAPTPPTVVSACGEVLSPSAPVITNSPNPLLCEGTRTYSYTYTDCEGNTANWSFVYTVLDNIAPTISCPANVVGCAGQPISFTPPVGTDNCLGAVTTQIAGLATGSVFPVGITTNTFKVTAANGQTAECSFMVTIQGKPTITLTTLQQTLNEGNAQTFCDTDANSVNGLQFTVSGSCVVGSPVWRSQVGSGAWSAWSPSPPVSQSSNNQPHRYQAACDASCPVTYTTPIELTINYRASTPQNVSLVADGVSVNEGDTKEVCNIEGNSITFNATCGAGETLLYSVDGGEYSSAVPTQLADNQYHNYRVRCRKSDGTVSCVESESGVMRFRITSSLAAPVASLNVTSGCGSPVMFSGTTTCGTLTTIWYNAVTNVALSSLPNQTPTETTSYYARCQAGAGCLSEKSNVVTYTVIPVSQAPAITVSQEIVCTGTTVTISANCPAGSQTFWNTGVTAPSFEVSFSNVTKQSYWAKCLFEGGCQSAESIHKDVYWNAFVVTLINIGESKSSVKVNDRAAWSSQFITRDGGPELEQSTQQNPTLYHVENANKMAPRYWTINVDACALGTDGSLTFDMLATPEMGIIRSFNTHENNAPYFMYANREGWTELYAQNHPAYGFYQDNGAGGNSYDAGLPKGLYKLGIRYWDQKGWGSIYPSTRKPQGNVLAYQEYWFRIQSKDGVGVGAARTADSGPQSAVSEEANGKGQGERGKGLDNGQRITDNGAFAIVLPNPVTHTLRLKVQESKGQVVQTTLSDAAGREVLSRQFIPETNTHQEEFGVSALPTGMYFLKVSTADQQATLKVVKVH